MILQTKKSLLYIILPILFVSLLLFSKELFFTPVLGSSSGTVTATVTVNPIKLDVQARPHSPIVNKKFKVQARVENLGSTTLNEVEATIFLPTGLRLLSEENQFLGSIDGGRKKRTSWAIRADETGHHIITVAVSAIDSKTGVLLADEASIIVEARSKPGKGLIALWYFFLNIFR